MSGLKDLATLCKEIDCLTEQVDTLRKERVNIGDWIDLTKLCKEIDDLTAQVDTLRKERDEARRLSCISFEDIIALATTGIASAPRHKYYEHANGRGWDCFKENM